MQPTQDMAAFFQLLHAIGVPGMLSVLLLPVAILAMLLFIFLRGDQKKWEAINTQNDTRWKEMLMSHKEERDRDFKHLGDLMESVTGIYQILTTVVSKVDQVDRGNIDLRAALNSLQPLFGDLHRRFDTILPHLSKGNHVRNLGSQGPFASGA